MPSTLPLAGRGDNGSLDAPRFSFGLFFARLRIRRERRTDDILRRIFRADLRGIDYRAGAQSRLLAPWSGSSTTHRGIPLDVDSLTRFGMMIDRLHRPRDHAALIRVR